ncbi:sentrin-specific protease 1-like [Sipha flava]|uniref:Sentrin-specific protease 1 n=2 Tax=Sipha flava TaxID=143950 RepID=A0A2S2QF46_9HEMI|nr:sentrin-specific protease 1-like [Sipha flava]
MAPRKRRISNISKNVDIIKGTSVVSPSAAKKSKIQSDQPFETDSLVLNCSEHLETIYSNLNVGTPMYWDEEITSENSDEFKKESLNNGEEDDVDDLETMGNENSDELEQEVIPLSEDENIECVDNFPTASSESSFIDEQNEDVDNEVEKLPVENASVDNGNMVIDLLDSDDSDDEEVLNDTDLVNLSTVEYCNYRTDAEYLRTIFPEFCSEMLMDLRSRFHKAKKSSQVYTYTGHRIGLTCDTIERLFRNDSWLNSDSINHYLQMLSNHRSDAHFSFDSYLLSDFKYRGYESTKRRTEGVDIFSKNVVFPVHLVQSHWALIYVDMKNHILFYIDSLLDNYEAECEVQMDEFIEYLHVEHLEKKNESMKNDWRKMVSDISPIQTNFIDCGVFVCLNAKTLILDKFQDFEQTDIPVLRVKILHEILSNQIIE